MTFISVSIVIFYRMKKESLEVWTQMRNQNSIYGGLLEFPGGKIEANEIPLDAAVREVKEEVGIEIDPSEAQFMGIYDHFINKALSPKKVALHVFLFPENDQLKAKGQWLQITKEKLSSPYEQKIPPANHRIIDDLFQALYIGHSVKDT